jgi:superfamily II DNA or RNA helicase
VTAFDARYLLGLSATPWRRDKLSRLIYWHLGDLAHKVETEALQENGDILRAEVLWRETAFTTDLDPREEYSAMLSELTKDQARNELIVSDVAREVESGSGTVLVLSDRKQHVSALAASLEARNVPTSTLAGDMPEKARVEALGAIKTGCARVLVATQQLVGEGIDLPVLSTLFLATPIRFDGRLIQSMGRVLRPAPGKDRAVVFDYEDVKVGPLRASARARQRVYKSTAAAVRQAA